VMQEILRYFPEILLYRLAVMSLSYKPEIPQFGAKCDTK